MVRVIDFYDGSFALDFTTGVHPSYTFNANNTTQDNRNLRVNALYFSNSHQFIVHLIWFFLLALKLFGELVRLLKHLDVDHFHASYYSPTVPSLALLLSQDNITVGNRRAVLIPKLRSSLSIAKSSIENPLLSSDLDGS